jgi:hypothetical protein
MDAERDQQPISREEHVAQLIRRVADAERRREERLRTNVYVALALLGVTGICVLFGIVGKPLIHW